jgi:chlorophyllide a reductase subunit Y
MDTLPPVSPPAAAEGAACHGGRETLEAAARAAGKSEVMDKLAADYPRGPHDQPQSMCPAFGSLRVGLRMRRVATILSGSACCVYGLTFTSHFYGARRTVGYVPFNSETLVTGKLFEDIRDAVHDLAKPEDYDAVIVTNLCVPTASGVPLDLLPKQINGVRVIGIDVPGFGVPTHAEAKDVLAGAMLRYARNEAEAGPVARPRDYALDQRSIAVIGELFPADPPGIGALIQPMGLTLAPQTPAREWRGGGSRASLLHCQHSRIPRCWPACGGFRTRRRGRHRCLAFRDWRRGGCEALRNRSRQGPCIASHSWCTCR